MDYHLFFILSKKPLKGTLMTGRQFAAIVAAVAFLVGGAFAAAFAMSSTTASPVVDNPPSITTLPPEVPGPAGAGIELPLVQLDGRWTAMNPNGTEFVADVSNGSIRIEMAGQDMSMLYWNGTFESSKAAGETVTSTKDESTGPVLSGSERKDFVVQDDTLSFEFSAMGMTKTVVLNRV